MTWFFLLSYAWLSSPARAAAGVGGILLFVWSVLPLASRAYPASSLASGEQRYRPGSIRDSFDGLRETWRGSWIRAIAGIAGFGLFLWSASPIATMPGRPARWLARAIGPWR